MRIGKLQYTRPDTGQALVLFAAGAAGFLGIIGMSIDIGKIASARTDLQKTADAAALAGAQELADNTPDPQLAKTVAAAYAVTNANIGDGAVDVDVQVNNGQDTVEVEVERNVKFAFLKVVGISEHATFAKAKARVFRPTGFRFGTPDVFPFMIWGGNPNYTDCNQLYGVCNGVTRTFRANDYRDQVTPHQQNGQPNNPNWNITSNTFKGYFHHGGEVVKTDSNVHTFANGGNATGQINLTSLQWHYDTGRPIVLPVVDWASCQGNCAAGGQMQFRIVGWVCMKVTQFSQQNVNLDWKGQIVPECSTPDGLEAGGANNPGTFSDIRTVRLVE